MTRPDGARPGSPLYRRQTRLLDYMAEQDQITNSEYQKLCPDVSSKTLRRDLAQLVRQGLLLKIGRNRGT